MANANTPIWQNIYTKEIKVTDNIKEYLGLKPWQRIGKDWLRLTSLPREERICIAQASGKVLPHNDFNREVAKKAECTGPLTVVFEGVYQLIYITHVDALRIVYTTSKER